MTFIKFNMHVTPSCMEIRPKSIFNYIFNKSIMLNNKLIDYIRELSVKY
jgi:hypothetical protein